ncbi:MAG TPA: hypothetical protein VF188_07180 [Longimicrobiales bacterium]
MRQLTMVAVAVLLGCASVPVEAQTAAGTGNGKARAPASEVGAYVGSGPVVVAKEVVDAWNYLYQYITEVEFVLCLEGSRQGGRIVIDGFRLARMEAPSSTSVRYHPCAADRYVGTAHNHPPTAAGGPLCYRSLPDRRSFEEDARAVVDVVLCGPDRYMWVLKDGTMGGPAREAEDQPAPPAVGSSPTRR